MRQALPVRSPHQHRHRPSPDTRGLELRESGIVPSRRRLFEEPRQCPPAATVLAAPRPDVGGFGAALASAGDVLLVAGRVDESRPFAAQYRISRDSAVRERIMRGAAHHTGPHLATDGVRVVVGERSADQRGGFTNIFRRDANSFTLEASLDERNQRSPRLAFGGNAALDGELLALAHSASVSVFRHSAVGWLEFACLEPPLRYGWNPHFGQALAVLGSRVLIGNPVEVDGHRAGPGRVFVYRQDASGSQLESILSGDGIEFGREQQHKLGFGASVRASGELVIITAPHELSRAGGVRGSVYLYRVGRAGLSCVAVLPVPSCQHGACIVGDRLFVLGDALYVFVRSGNGFAPKAAYDMQGASGMIGCGDLVALSHPEQGRVALHFAAQF